MYALSSLCFVLGSILLVVRSCRLFASFVGLSSLFLLRKRRQVPDYTRSKGLVEVFTAFFFARPWSVVIRSLVGRLTRRSGFVPRGELSARACALLVDVPHVAWFDIFNQRQLRDRI